MCRVYRSFVIFPPKKDLALKSPKIIVKIEQDDATVFTMPSKFEKNSSNSAVFCWRSINNTNISFTILH